MAENPYASPRPIDSQERVGERTSTNVDGTISFTGELSKKFVIEVFANRDRLSWVLLGLLIAGIVMSAGLIHWFMPQRSHETGSVVFLTIISLIPICCVGFVFWFERFIGNGWAAYRSFPHFRSRFRGKWDARSCAIEFEHLTLRFDPQTVDFVVKESAILFWIPSKLKAAKLSGKVSVVLPRVIFREQDWQSVLLDLSNHGSTGGDNQVDPMEVPAEAIPVYRLPFRWRWRLELVEAFSSRWILWVSLPIVVLSGLIVAYVHFRFYAHSSRLPNWTSNGQFFWYSDLIGMRRAYVAALTFLVISCIVSLHTVWLLWLARRSAPYLGSLLLPVEAWIAKEGIVLMKREKFRVGIPWSAKLTRWNSPAGIRVVLPISWTGFYPKRAFANESDWNSAKSLIESNVQSKR